MSGIFDRRRAAVAERVKPAGVAAVSSFPIRRSLEQRRVVLAVAGAMFAAAVVLRQTSSDAADVIALLAVVPIALVALEFGLLVGVGAAILALALVEVFALDVHSGTVGVYTAAVAYLAIGAVAGRFGDRMRDAQARQHLLLRSGLALAHLDGADGIPATLAQRARELAPCSRGARVELSGAAAVESGVVGQDGAQERVRIELHGVRYGTLVASGSRPLTDEDRATLAILALQAAVAAENQRLLESERERAVIRAELQDARLHLAERGGQLREFIARLEAERGQVAHELHEDAAQVLAAVLLGLGALERELGSNQSAPRLGDLRSDINSTLQSLRSLAVSLEPPALQLGLQVALEALGDTARARGFGKVSVEMQAAASLSPEAATMVYRIVEETLEAVGPARALSVRAGADRNLVIELQGATREITPERLTILTARIELIGGTFASTTSRLRATIPLPALSGGFAMAA